MSWLRERGRSILDNAAYDVVRNVVLLLWPFIGPLIYLRLAQLGKLEWSWWVNAGLLLVSAIIISITAYKLIKKRSVAPRNNESSFRLKSGPIDDQHPLAVAMDDLRALHNEMFTALLGPYYVADHPKPTMDDVNRLSVKMRACARKQAWGDLIRLSDLKRLEDHSLDGNMPEIKAKYAAAGYLDNLNPTQILVFEAGLNRWERLKELIAKIEERDQSLEKNNGLESVSVTSDQSRSWKQMERFQKQVDDFNAQQRRQVEERKARLVKRNEVLDRVGELIRARKSRKPNPNPSRQNMFGLLVQAGSHRLDTEEDMVMVCDQLVAAGNEHPFQMFDKEYSPVVRGEWLEFVKMFHVSGFRFEDISAWSFAVGKWRGKDRWLNRPKPEPRSINWTNEEQIEEPLETEKRKFTNRTVHELLALYDCHTALQGDKLMEPHKGLWIEVEAKIGYLGPDNQGSVAVLRTLPEDHAVECRFSSKWNNELARFNTGDVVKACGKISSNQNGQQLYLLECELLT